MLAGINPINVSLYLQHGIYDQPPGKFILRHLTQVFRQGIMKNT